MSGAGAAGAAAASQTLPRLAGAPQGRAAPAALGVGFCVPPPRWRSTERANSWSDCCLRCAVTAVPLRPGLGRAGCRQGRLLTDCLHRPDAGWRRPALLAAEGAWRGEAAGCGPGCAMQRGGPRGNVPQREAPQSPRPAGAPSPAPAAHAARKRLRAWLGEPGPAPEPFTRSPAGLQAPPPRSFWGQTPWVWVLLVSAFPRRAVIGALHPGTLTGGTALPCPARLPRPAEGPCPCPRPRGRSGRAVPAAAAASPLRPGRAPRPRRVPEPPPDWPPPRLGAPDWPPVSASAAAQLDQ